MTLGISLNTSECGKNNYFKINAVKINNIIVIQLFYNSHINRFFVYILN